MTLMESIGAEVVSPEAAGMSSQRLSRIGPTIEALVKDNRLPGVMTLLQRRGKVVHFGKFGMVNIEANEPIREDNIFRIYSMTKQVVSVAAMMLLEEGRFRLNDPVARFIPAFAKTKVYAGSSALGLKLVDQETPMTVHHLLTHTGGTNTVFATTGLLGDSNLLQHAIQNAVFGTAPSLSLDVTRMAGVVDSRTDLDQSQFPSDVSPGAGPVRYGVIAA